MKQVKIWKMGWWLLLLMLGCWTLKSTAVEFEETVFKTGVVSTGPSIIYSVSPDGTRILFTTSTMADGLRLLDLKSGQVTRVREEAGHYWEMANWSHDGQHVVAISTAIRDRRYQVGEQEVILIDPRDWSHRRLAATPGVNINPFFSYDGNAIYYFKGKKRESGKTPASWFDLYAYDLSTDRETRLTHHEMYQVSTGYEDGSELSFSASGLKNSTPGCVDPKSGIYLYSSKKATLQFCLFGIDQSDNSFYVYFGDKDAAGNIYFKAVKKNPGGGHSTGSSTVVTSGGKTVPCCRRHRSSAVFAWLSARGNSPVDSRSRRAAARISFPGRKRAY
jgi:Tol biopolymer transport system component